MNYGAANSPQNSGERWVLEFCSRRMSEIPVVFDVGANTGQWAKLALDILGTSIDYYGFEPITGAYERLQKNISEIYPEGKVFNFGFSDSLCEKTIFYSAKGDVQATFHPDPELEPTLMRETVHLETIDSFISSSQIEKVDYLKIDAEGHEHSILKGACRSLNEGKIKFIQFEFGEKHIQSKTFLRDIFELLPQYSIYRVLQNGIAKIEYSPEKEIFIGTNYLCISKREAKIIAKSK